MPRVGGSAPEVASVHVREREREAQVVRMVVWTGFREGRAGQSAEGVQVGPGSQHRCQVDAVVHPRHGCAVELETAHWTSLR
ncbi:hypothetical protein D3C73_1462510 [compost metagenome]